MHATHTRAHVPRTRAPTYIKALLQMRGLDERLLLPRACVRARPPSLLLSLSLSLSLSRLFLFLLRRLCATLSFVAGRSKDERVSCPLLFLPRREIFRGDFRGFLMGGSFEIFCASQERQEAESDEAGTKASKGEEWPWLREE
jgi:hypothetical protein